MNRPIAVLKLLALCCLLVASNALARGSWVELHGHRYNVELAITGPERAQGLMFRDALAPGAGMLFIHDSERPLAYWMKNTRIALDILYFDHDRRLVSVVTAPPCDLGNDCPPFPSQAPALYVLELSAGEVHKRKIVIGTTLKVSKDIAALLAH